MTSGETTTTCSRRAYGSSGNRRKNHTVPSPSFRTCMAICGISSNSLRMTRRPLECTSRRIGLDHLSFLRADVRLLMIFRPWWSLTAEVWDGSALVRLIGSLRLGLGRGRGLSHGDVVVESLQ